MFDDHRRLVVAVDHDANDGRCVRVTVELPADTMMFELDGPDDAGPFGYLRLSPDRADQIAAQFADAARLARNAGRM
jgi:hypothetical protein